MSVHYWYAEGLVLISRQGVRHRRLLRWCLQVCVLGHIGACFRVTFGTYGKAQLWEPQLRVIAGSCWYVVGNQWK